MQHEVRTRSKYVVKRIFNVTQGHQQGDQPNFKSRLLKKVSPDFNENIVYTQLFLLFRMEKRIDQNWMILKPEVIFETGSV